MSDEEVNYRKRTKVIHYGSLEEGERKRAAAGQSSSTEPSTATAKGHINISNQYMSIEPQRTVSTHQLVIDEFEKKRKARQITVTVDDHQVQAHLRHLEEPICKLTMTFIICNFHCFLSVKAYSEKDLQNGESG